MPPLTSETSVLTVAKRPTSAAFHAFVRRLHMASQTDDPVLLAGEVGTGKRQSATTVHNVSGRSAHNFVQIDCLGIKESKFELEILGSLNPYNHQLRQGAVSLAEGGTLYLHEVGELPPASQTLLLRLMESDTYSPVNSSDTYNSDFRLITSSSQDLMAMVEHGKFRNDLLHHINTLTIRTPSLNERREDIADLVNSILQEIPGGRHKQVSPEAMEVLCHHKYTANILELRNIIHRLVGTFDAQCYSGLQVVQAIHAGTPSSKSERVIEKKSQRSMLPDFNGYLDQAQNNPPAFAQTDQAVAAQQSIFQGASHSAYASTTYHIGPQAAQAQAPAPVQPVRPAAHKVSDIRPRQAQAPQQPPAWRATVAAMEFEEDTSGPFTALKSQEREYIARLVEYCNGDKKKAADIAGVTLRTLYRKLKH
ncbi:sigma 54-interacting transcriptional regulator [Limnohabitans sp. T6-5]|uniref:sigma 54-interacting transcriptional regulator n=1 Tax=Limnohabitans sp. T6-5 TaxID=1100724 RepID=UPI0011B28D05|nr:sigma 54-interacting transcriptional regulator [Limnohabitans sp. T6-5]